MAEEHFAEMVQQNTFEYINFCTKDIGEGTIFDIADIRYRSNLILKFALLSVLVIITFAIWHAMTKQPTWELFGLGFIAWLIAAVGQPLVMLKTHSYKICVCIQWLSWLSLSTAVSSDDILQAESHTLAITAIPMFWNILTNDFKFSLVLMQLVWMCQVLIKSWSSNYVKSLCTSWLDLQEYVDTQFQTMVVQFYLQDIIGLTFIYLCLNYSVKIQNVMNELLKKTIQSEKSKDIFIAAMSHEFRSPLNSLLGSIDLLINANIQGLTPKQSELLETAQNWSEILLHLVNNVLDVSKLQSDNLDLAPTATDIRKSIIKLLNITKLGANKKGLRLEFQADFFLPKYIKIDQARLNQVLINLISNAIKFTSKGQVLVRIEYKPDKDSTPSNLVTVWPQKQFLERGFSNFEKFDPEDCVIHSHDSYNYDGEIEENAYVAYANHYGKIVKNCFVMTDQSYRISRPNTEEGIEQEWCFPGYEKQGFLKIHVEDSGIGMTYEESSRLFKPFVQANESIFQDFGGTGLGLWLSQQIIKLFNGEISISSEEGVGSTFTVQFPVEVAISHNDENYCTDEHLQDQIIDGISGCRLLVAEDNAYNQGVFNELIRSIQCLWTVVPDGEQLLEAYKTNHENLDAILTDFDMPKLDGIGTSNKIREFEQWIGLPKIPIIVITANATSNLRSGAEKSGWNDFLAKPIDRFALARSIHRHVCSRNTILIIDDDKIWLTAIKQILHTEGYNFKAYPDPKSALEYIVEHYNMIIAVISDFNLPSMSGVEFVKAIINWENSNSKRKIPIFICSGNPNEDVVRQWLNIGVKAVLSKPCSSQDLKIVLDRHLHNNL